MEWHERLQRQIDKLGIDMAELSRRSGVNYDSINKYLRGDVKQPRGNILAKLAKAVGVTEIWLRDGMEVMPRQPRRGQRHEADTLDNSAEPRILELETRGGAGGPGMDIRLESKKIGRETFETDSVVAEWLIPSVFLRGQLRVNPSNAWIIEIYGDSMYDPANPGAPGSLFPSDRVIVDTGDKRPSPPGAFAVHDGVGLVVKLVEVISRTEPVMLRLSSRNPTYAPYEVSVEEAQILGRVRGRISAM